MDRQDIISLCVYYDLCDQKVKIGEWGKPGALVSGLVQGQVPPHRLPLHLRKVVFNNSNNNNNEDAFAFNFKCPVSRNKRRN